MKQSLRPGVTKTRRVQPHHQRESFADGVLPIVSSEWIVHEMEHTCLDLILEHADAGENSVGTEVTLHNLIPPPAEREVEITVSVTAVEGRKVSFDFSVRDEAETISHGKHDRYVVDVATTIKRLKAKAARRASAAEQSK